MVAPTATAPDVPRLLDRAEHDLVELVRIGQQLVVVDLDDERDLVRPVPRHRAEHAEGRGDRVAPALDGELDDACRGRSTRDWERTTRRPSARSPGPPGGSTRSPCRRAGRAGRSTERLRRTRLERSVPVQMRSTKSGPGRCSSRLGNRLAFMLQQGRGVVAEQLFDGFRGGKRCGCHGRLRYMPAIRLDATL